MRPRYPGAIEREHTRLMLAHARRLHELALPRLREAVDAFGGELRQDDARGDVSPLLELVVGVVGSTSPRARLGSAIPAGPGAGLTPPTTSPS